MEKSTPRGRIKRLKKSSSKKLTKKIFDDGHTLLNLLRYGSTSPKYLAIELGIPKQNLNYMLKKLQKEGIIKRRSKGSYFMTDSGKRIHDQYERYKNKQMIRIENMKVTFIVEEGGSKLEEQLVSQKQELKNNVKIYHATLNLHSTRLIVGKSDYKFEVTITNTLDVDLNEAYHRAMLEAYGVAMYLDRWFDVKLSEGYCTGKPEIAIPSPVASALLSTMGVSQIRTNKAIMNRSKGRGADWEVHTLQQAQKIVDMPNAISRMEERLENMEWLFSSNQNSNIYRDLAGNLPNTYMEFR